MRTIKIFQTPFEMAEAMALEIINYARKAEKANLTLTIALSGGTTPVLLFTVLGDHFGGAVSWNHVHFFWVDERLVAPDSFDSNYGMADSAFFQKTDISSGNIHRIWGENDPDREVLRYGAEIEKFTGKRKGLPMFDMVLLGLGEDGHTASIFPGNEELFRSGKICVQTIHPLSGQKRITLTGKVINNARALYFLVTGRSKAHVVKTILGEEVVHKPFPASYVRPVNGALHWYIDKEAGSLFNHE